MISRHRLRSTARWLFLGRIAPLILLVAVSWPGYYLFRWLAKDIVYFPFLAACNRPHHSEGIRINEMDFVYGPYTEEFKALLIRYKDDVKDEHGNTVPSRTKNGILYFRLIFYSSDVDLVNPWRGYWDPDPYNLTTNLAYIILQRRLTEAKALPPGEFLKMHMRSGHGEIFGHWAERIDECATVEELIREDGFLAHPLKAPGAAANGGNPDQGNPSDEEHRVEDAL